MRSRAPFLEHNPTLRLAQTSCHGSVVSGNMTQMSESNTTKTSRNLWCHGCQRGRYAHRHSLTACGGQSRSMAKAGSKSRRLLCGDAAERSICWRSAHRAPGAGAWRRAPCASAALPGCIACIFDHSSRGAIGLTRLVRIAGTPSPAGARDFFAQ
jgi:hypothetical protein